MTSIATKERELYSAVWQSVAQYGAYSPGESYLPLFLQMIGERRGTIMDAGCGSGKGALALKAAGFDVTLSDITREGLVPEAQQLPFLQQVLWEDMPDLSFDYVYCCDVMEHIPTPFTMLVIRQLLSVARGGVFISISLMPDSFGVLIGQSLHQSVQTFPQWRDQLNTIGRVVEARDLLHTGVYFVERR
jgi:2-polyprenyl-3-methyl-5-hydroxy-6-metoxy-1,4-benzoquinol methylase